MKLLEDGDEALVVNGFSIKERSKCAKSLKGMGISPDGIIHLSFDHHLSTLRYRTTKLPVANHPESHPWTADLFGPVQDHLGGPRITSVTYPVFHTDGTRFLLYLRLGGGSGSANSHLFTYQDRYRDGWDVIREERAERLKKLGIADCELPPLELERNPRWNMTAEELKSQVGVGEEGRAVPWDSLSPAQQEFQARKMAVHAAMVHRMDIEIGRVLKQIEAMGELENTLVLFISDNGASSEIIMRGDGNDPSAPVGSAESYTCLGSGWSTASNTPFRLHKAWVYEGGITTPLIVNWPVGIKDKGGLRHDPGHLIDILPTLFDLTGAVLPDEVEGLPVPPLPGKSLVPNFASDGNVKHDFLWFFHDGNRTIRVGDWKIVADYLSLWELYNLAKDPSETKNLAAEMPDKVRELERIWLKETTAIAELALQDMPAAPAIPAVDPNAVPAAGKPQDAADAEPEFTTTAVKLKLKQMFHQD